jgi:enamine deaminase RidA (YjgF/YER057c/UK114 family)
MPRLALEPSDYPFFDYRRFTFSLGISAGENVWLSGSTAVRFDAARKAMVVDGDLVEQARVVFDKMRMTLAAGGLGLRNIVRIVQYVTPGALADLPRLNAFVTGLLAGAAPAVSTVVVKSLLRDEALIEIEAVATGGGHSKVEYLPSVTGTDCHKTWSRADRLLASRGLGRQDVVRTIEFLTPAAAPHARQHDGNAGTVIRVLMPRLVDDDTNVQLELGASRGACDDVVFATAMGDPAAGDVAGQCKEIYARLGHQLAASGAGLDMVVKTTEFVTPGGLGDYRKTAEVRREVFAPPFPAATGVVCEGLPAAGAQIAVEAVAVRALR